MAVPYLAFNVRPDGRGLVLQAKLWTANGWISIKLWLRILIHGSVIFIRSYRQGKQAGETVWALYQGISALYPIPSQSSCAHGPGPI